MSVPAIYQRNLKDFAFQSTKRVVADTYTRPSSATQYTAGDIVANSGTAASVVPITFNNVTRTAGSGAGARIVGARCIITPASSNLVITACDIDLLLFRPDTNIPFAAGSYPADNAALTLTAAMYKSLVAVIPFVNGAWRNQLGALTAGTVGCQLAVPSVINPAYADLSDFAVASNITKLYGLLQVKDAWNPGAVAQAIDLTLFVNQD